MIPPSLPLAFGFGSPAMLWWLAAGAAPIVIHLLSRRRYRETSWAAIEYLLSAMKKHARRIRLEQLILLAVRTLVIALVVLAVSKPYLERSRVPFTVGARTHRVLVLDGSYSMSYEAEGVTCFQRAKQLAAQIVKGASEGDGFTLVLMSSPPRVVVGTPALVPAALGPADFLRELDQVTLPHTTAKLPETLEKIEEVLANARREAPGLSQREVYFLTDLQRVGWQAELPEAEREQFLARTRRLAEQAHLVILDVGQPDEENLAVTGVRALEPVVTLAQGVTIQADVKNFGQQTRSDYPSVELLVDGRPAGQPYLPPGKPPVKKNLEPGQKVSLFFSHAFEIPGDHAVEIRLQRDALDVDNHRWLSVSVKKSIDVLLVDGDLGGAGGRGAGEYLRLALAPWVRQAEPGRIEVRTVSESELLEEELGRYDCVFLANVAQFTADEAQALRSYLERGGGLVFFLGDRVLAQRYNEELWGDGSLKTRVLPARLGRTAAEGLYTVNPLEYKHPIVAAFGEYKKAGLATTLLRRYVKLSVPKRRNGDSADERAEQPQPSGASVALAVAGNDPLIVEETLGRGRSIIVATSADPSWSLMPVWPSFVPVVQELLSFATGGQRAERNLMVGQELAGTVPTRAIHAPLSIHTPDRRVEKVRIHPKDDHCRWAYAPGPGFSHTAVSGIYRAVFGPPLSRSDVFAVNVNTVESDLRRLSEQELRQVVWPEVDFDLASTWEESEQPVLARSVPRGMLDKGLLYLALALLFVEMYLAWRFGRH